MAGEEVKLLAGNLAQYESLSVKDENTLYFIEDAKRIYKGSTEMTQCLQIVTSFPSASTALEGKLYINAATNEAQYKSNNSMVSLLPGYITTKEQFTDANGGKLATISATKGYVADLISQSTAAIYNDDITSTNSSASENDIRIDVANISLLVGRMINVNLASNKASSPYITGRRYLLNNTETLHSSTAGLPIAVLDPDINELVPGDTSHYNPYFVPMNTNGIMKLLIKDTYALWLNPPFYYCIDADKYLGKNLQPYDDPDWKCKIFRGEGFVTIQGVCQIKTGSTLNPSVAGEREIINGNVLFRPISHSRVKCCTRYDSSEPCIPDDWVCTVDYADGSIWVSQGNPLSSEGTFCINQTYAVCPSASESII